jgi:hypothetical protein
MTGVVNETPARVGVAISPSVFAAGCFNPVTRVFVLYERLASADE